MKVIKRNGKHEDFKYNKIAVRIKNLCKNPTTLSTNIDIDKIATKTTAGIKENITTYEIDVLAAETAAACTTEHTDYAILAARIAVSNLHKNTTNKFSETMKLLYDYVSPHTKDHAPQVSKETYNIALKHRLIIDKAIKHERDYNFDYFGYKTLERSYLLKIDKDVIERPQYMYMRCAIGIHGNDIEKVLQTYDRLSQGYFTHASPTLFNSGTPRPQLASCFLIQMEDDSMNGIYNTIKDLGMLSKYAGGFGINVHNIRATGSYIRGTRGYSDGLIPMLRVFNETARYVNQGGKRKGAVAIYLEPWHADILDFLDLRKNQGKEERRCRDLFLALWMNDLFMERLETAIKEKKHTMMWSLFCPHEAPGLDKVFGEKFRKLYEHYELEKKFKRQIPILEVWAKILESQIETGNPYIVYKDACNEKSNQKNLGIIKSSNLCTEIVQYSSKSEIATCNLASIALPKFVKDKGFNFNGLYDITYMITDNLNKVIDRTMYPVEKTKTSNLAHRPIGIGVQGLADTYIKMRYPYESKEARTLNIAIFETMYHAALRASCDLAKKDGYYKSFIGSPTSQGILQFDMWKVEPSKKYDWMSLKEEIKKHGLRNSLLLTVMPTASTAQILGNNEGIEPFTSNIYARRVLSGEFIVANKYLVQDLIELGLWSEEMKNKILENNGSIQAITLIPDNIKQLYKTVWEISQKEIIDQAADRAAFICQSQSLNIHIEDPNNAKLTSMHVYGWKKGLKTGSYYIRSRPAIDPIKFTLERTEKNEVITNSCSANNDEDCVSCGS